MNSKKLDSLVQEYENLIHILLNEELCKENHSTYESAKVDSKLTNLEFQILMIRDRIQSLLDDYHNRSDELLIGSEIQKLKLQDEKLKKNQLKISQHPDYLVWQESFSHPDKYWWWKFEIDKDKWFSRTNGISSLLSLVCLTISIGLMGDITPRFLLGNPDPMSATIASVQSILTLITAKSALTEQGQLGLKSFLKSIKIPDKYWHELAALSSILLMLSFLGIQKSLSLLSDYYTKIAEEKRKDGDWGTAEEEFKRALYLNTDNKEAQFFLGNLHEDLQQLDQSQIQYRLSFQGGKIEAGNNLARLYIRKKEPSSAISLLYKIQASPEPLEPNVKHAVLKNIGWSRFLQKSYPQAKAALIDAIELESELKLEPHEMASPHCLMAQVLDNMGEKREALKEWSICNANATSSIPEQDEWLVLAKKRLSKM